MRRALLLVCSALLTSTLALAQPHDVDGWGQTKWGMTAADIQRLFPSAKAGPCTPHQKNCGTRIEVPGVDVAGVKCSVILTLDKSGKLDLVLLAPVAPTRKSADALLSGLTEKYGRPTSREQNVWTWTFTTTTISLSSIISGDFGMVFLSYQRRASLQPNL